MPSLHAKPRKNADHVATATATPVAAIMTHDVVTVASGTSVESVTSLMLERRLSRVPVVNVHGELIGLVSKTDLVERAHLEGDTGEARRLPNDVGGGFHVEAAGAVVDDVMSRSVIGVGDDASIQRAAELMVGQQVHGLPVITRAGKLIGFVSTMDILAWLAGLR